MKIAICDDENFFINELKPLVFAYGNRKRFEIVIEVFNSGNDLIRSPQTFDMIFLDYQMEGLDGMETARILRDKNITCTIIFVTNYPDFVYEAFTVDTFRFLRKPIDPDIIDSTFDAYFQKYGNDYPILLQSQNEIATVETKNIVFLEANHKHCSVHTVKEIYDCAKTMGNINKLLPRSHFYKVGKAFIVNFNFIDRFTNEQIFFHNGEYVYISRRYYVAFKYAYKNYLANRNPVSLDSDKSLLLCENKTKRLPG